MARRVVLKPSALPFLIVYIFRREAAWQMEISAFDIVVDKITKLEEPFRKEKKTLQEVEQTLYEAYSTTNLDYGRLKTYLECKILEYDTDMKKWVADFLLSVTKFILPVLVGATALQSDKLEFEELLCLFGVETVISMIFVGIICIWLGYQIELPMKIQHNKKRFYEICLKILEQYIPPKNEVNNSQNLKCIVKINVEQNRKQFGKFKWENVRR